MDASTLSIKFVAGPELFGLLFVFARVTALFHTLPLFSMKSVPVPARIALSGLIALSIAPAAATVDPVITTWDLPRLGLLLCSELFLGLAMGFCVACVLSVIEVLGTFLGNNSGLGMAVQFDPVSDSQSLIVTRIVQIAGFLSFLALDLHHVVLYALADSFQAAPPGQGIVAFTVGPAMSQVVGQVLLDSMRIAMPVIAAVMFLNLVSTLVTRFAQQMNIYFSVGLSANAVGGILAISVAMPALIAVIAGSGKPIRFLMTTVVGG